MDIVTENYHDSLNYLDSEYENPVIKYCVDSLIKSEMSSSTKSLKDYLLNLPPLPKFKYANSKKSEEVLLDMKRYEISAPEPPHDKSIEDWKSAVCNAKSQLENQNNRLVNLELCEKNVSAVWLGHNNSVEQTDKFLANVNDNIAKEIQAVNYERKDKQEQAKVVLDKILRRRDDSINKSWQIEISCRHMENSLANPINMQKASDNEYSNQQNKKAKLNN